jgi:hypothetical protein
MKRQRRKVFSKLSAQTGLAVLFSVGVWLLAQGPTAQTPGVLGHAPGDVQVGRSTLWAAETAESAHGQPAPTRKERELVETYPDGKKKAVYALGPDGVKTGPFKEFYPDGKTKAEGSYKQDKLHGPYKAFHPNGKLQIRAVYREGQYHGQVEEFGEDGLLKTRANYKEGQYHGLVQHYEGKQLVQEEFWLDGQLILPRSPGILAAELAAIQKMPVETVGQLPSQTPAVVLKAIKDPAAHARREAALRVLMNFRCLCGVPYKDLKLDWTYIAHCEAASYLLSKVGKLEHTPANPGLPDAEYRFGFEGTSKSNLHFSTGEASPIEAVRGFMDDSDPKNIEAVGHRRWCLNPAMLKTGFGSGWGYTAMWSMDGSRTQIPDYDFVAFPPRGLVPAASFKSHYAWSVSLNPKKYQTPDATAVKVQILPAKLSLKPPGLEKAPVPLPIGYFHVDTGGFGIPNCIIFRPAGFKVVPGSAYWVEITGLKTASGQDTKLGYLVAFIAL